MLDAVLALNGLDTRVFDAVSTAPPVDNVDDYIVVPDAHLLFNGEFKHVGTTGLKITGDDGRSFYIENYFNGDQHKHLLSPEGAVLTANLVEALAGPLAPGQHAQAGGGQSAAQTVIGRVESMTGSCTVIRNGVSVSLNIGDNVQKGDVVQTAGSSSVAIVFTDGSTFNLSANARMVLDEFVYNAAGSNNSAVISLVQGTFSFVAGQVAKNGDMKVETPVATMGIRGTAVQVEISADNGKTSFSVMVEPNGVTGSFNLYNKANGALIGTVNNSAIGWTVTPAGPLQVVAQQVEKTPAQLQQELNIVQQMFTILNNYQQNPIPQEERRGDNPDSGQQTASASGSGGALNTDQQPSNIHVSVTPVQLPNPSGGDAPPLSGSNDKPDPVSAPGNKHNDNDANPAPPLQDQPVPLPVGDFNIAVGTNGNDRIIATSGNDRIAALDGDDLIVVPEDARGGNDFFDGGAGHNTLQYEGTSGLTFHLNVGTRVLADGEVAKISTVEGPGIGHEEFVHIQRIVGTGGNDIFILHDLAYWQIDGGDGIDIVRIAGDLDFTGEARPFLYNVEIFDLNQDSANTITFSPIDVWIALGWPDPGLDASPIGEHASALRILGGVSDVINISDIYYAGEEGPAQYGHWQWVGHYIDPDGDDIEGDPFHDHVTDGTAFNIYQFVAGDFVVATVYIQDSVTVHADTVSPADDFITITENQTILFDVVANDAPESLDLALSDLGEATVSGPSGVPLGDPLISIVDNQISIVPGTAFDALAVGQSATITIPYSVRLESGETFNAVATVTVTGSNDRPVVTGGTTSGAANAASAHDVITPVGAGYLAANHDLINGLGGESGFGEHSLGRTDDGSSGAIDITSVFGEQGINFFGHHYTSIYINNNGNITFSGPSGSYTPDEIGAGADNPIIAAYWADVDTWGGPADPSTGGNSTGSNLVYYDLDTDARVLTITWDDVGYYSSATDRLNAFQLQLIDRGGGDFDVVFRYEDIDWTTGDASYGSGGLGGTPARAGYSAGDGNSTHYFELPGSGDQDAMLALEGAPGNTGIPGVHIFHVRSGGVSEAPVTGTIHFSDPDAADTHTVSASFNAAASGRAAALGYLTAVVTHDSAGGASGDVAWRYNIDPEVQNNLDPGATLTEIFDVVISDGHGGTVTQQVTITVQGPLASEPETPNAAPVAASDSAFAFAGEPVTIDVLANDTDANGDPLSIVAVGDAGHGTVEIVDGRLVYTPAEGFSGTDEFTYTISDPDHASATGHVSVVVGRADHGKVGGDVFLQGNYMEIGVSASGSLGTANNAPTGYHPQGGFRNLSYVVDIDGWDSGNPPTAGDFTLPGSPVDTIAVGHDGRSFANDERYGRRDIPTTTEDASDSGLLRAVTAGVTATGLHFTQVITLDPSATYYVTTITLENTTDHILSDVRFMRSFDPDQDVARYSSYHTYNDVLANPQDGGDIAVAQAYGPNSHVSVNLIAFDQDARASNFGFANYNVYASQAYNSPQDRNGLYVDEAITLTFDGGDLAPGEQTSFQFYTSLNGNQGANDFLVGTGGADRLDAGAGNDILLGLGGDDTLIGGAGNDRFIFDRHSGHDTILDFVAGAATDDVIEIHKGDYSTFEDLITHADFDGNDTTIHIAEDASVKLLGIDVALLHRDDFSFIL